MNRLSGKIILDFRDNLPLYLQIAHQIEQLVAKGELKLGDQLPTVRELATELRINFNTVGRAYHVLDETRLISTQRGRGTYIWEEPTEEIMKQLRQKSLEELAHNYLAQVEQLGYTPQDGAEAVQKLLETFLSDDGHSTHKDEE